jgi:hypothetical protein
MRIALLVLIVFSCTSNAYANWFSNKLSVYECKSEYEATSCSSKCKKDAELKLEFLVDKKNSRVMTKWYMDKKISNSGVSENCKIFNDKNWDCTSEHTFGNRSDTYINKMNNGIFSAFTRNIFVSNTNQVTSKESNFICAK